MKNRTLRNLFRKMNYKRTKTNILFLFAIIFITGLLFYIFYQKNINIYEPVSFEFTDFEASDSSLIKISCITPLGKEIPLVYSLDNNNWETNDGSYSKSIILVINDSIADKYKTINVNISNKIVLVSINDLEIIKKSSNENHYVLPPEIRSEKSFLKKTQYIISTNHSIILATIPFIIILLIIINLKSIINPKIESKIETILNSIIYKWVKVICFSAIIALALFYGYLLIKYTISCYITSVIFVIISGIIIWYLNLFIIKLDPRLKKHSGKTKKIILIFILIWIVTESSLRFFGITKGYNETLTGFYASGFNRNSCYDSQSPQLLVYDKQTYFSSNKGEYPYIVKSNADGLRDSDHSIEKEKDEIRIICLGNSFTEGVGTPQDSTWPKLLENKLRKVYNRKTSVFNAGISGSDPFFEYMLLKKRMLKYKPDFVLVALQVTDFNFFRLRGGFERFTADGCQFRKPPYWERLYAVSYIFRYVLNNLLNYKENYLQSQSDYRTDSIKANIDIKNCIQRFHQLSLKENFNLAIIFLDDRGDSRYNFLIEKLNKENIIPVMDLRHYNKNIKKLSDKNLESYFWKNDMHCNPKGYDLISKGIMWNFNNLGMLDSLKHSPDKTD